MSAEPDKQALLRQLRIDRSGEQGPSPRRPWYLAAALLVLLLAGAVLALQHFTRHRIEIQAVTALAPGGAGPTAILQATGYVTARRQATVSAQITGTLTRVMIEEGDRVQAGQVLARLDDTAQAAALAQAEAQAQAAEAQLHQVEAQLAQARRDLARNEDLVQRQLVSQQALETARTQVETLSAQVEAQRKQLQLARASVQGAQVQLGYTTIRAPFAGVIVAKAAQAGEIVSPISAGGGFTRTGVGTIVDMDSLEIEVDVNEAYIHRVQPGQAAQATLDAYPDWNIPAHVIAIIPTADRSKATVKVRIGIDQKDPRILPDMGVRVSFLEAAPSAAAPPRGVLLPASAVVPRAGRSVVYVIDGERARERAVTAAASVGELRRVEGIAAGTRVVRAPPEGLRDGDRISVRAGEN
ncbi:MAG: efflux RND transporter periplasmic adaptor subunit [Gammaproteobacteria bacterium]|nr:efflux RND transporter periplasmic adaptor subunit [Gammaproteobacteria bacterium]